MTVFAFHQDGGDYLGGRFFTEGLETIFQLRTEGKGAGRKMHPFTKACIIKATLWLNVFLTHTCASGRGSNATFTGFSKRPVERHILCWCSTHSMMSSCDWNHVDVLLQLSVRMIIRLSHFLLLEDYFDSIWTGNKLRILHPRAFRWLSA